MNFKDFVMYMDVDAKIKVTRDMAIKDSLGVEFILNNNSTYNVLMVHKRFIGRVSYVECWKDTFYKKTLSGIKTVLQVT